MSPRNRPVPVRPILAVLIGLVSATAFLPGPSILRAQVPATVGAELPHQGEVWFELAPTFESWSEQFALGSDTRADGSAEPLYSDFDGPVTDRLYPGAAVLAEALNRGADSLGYGPMVVDGVSLGSLDFRSLTARRTALPLRAVGGVTPRVALEVGVDFVQTQTEASFAYDSAGATVAPATIALPEGGAYLDGLSSARQSLESRLESGELSAEQEAQARDLLERTGAFAAVLERRLDGSGLLPLAGSAAGDAMAGLASDFAAGFQEFEIAAPSLGLASVAGRAALDAFFGGPFLEAGELRGGKHGLQPARLNAGLRVGLLDTYPAEDSLGRLPGGVHLRTTAGLRVRWPLGEPDAAPFLTPSSFLDTPVGPGARVVEASIYQDAAVGALRMSAAAGYGNRLADEVTLRIHSPGRPFAFPETEAALEREPGDYLWLRFSPRLAVNPSLSLGGEYAYWNEGETSFTIAGSPGGDGAPALDADPLGRETGGSRHDVGIGVYYTASGAAPGPGSRPVEAAFTYRLAVAGSGGQTPSPNVVGVRIRVPMGLF